MTKTKFGVVVFPGSNCDHDAQYVLSEIFHQDARFLWHKDSSIGDVDAVVLPGGFSYGDYLRCGAIARFSPIMKDVINFATKGGIVIGICNGFQILCEAGLLPGALLRNASLRFVCKYVHLRVENAETLFTSRCKSGEVLEIPIAHGDGNYFADADTIQRLEDNRQIVFRYCEPDGLISDRANPNGSLNNIAGIINEQGNILGLMPHPERASDPVLKHVDGQKIFQSIIESFVLLDSVRSTESRQPSRRSGTSLDYVGSPSESTTVGRPEESRRTSTKSGIDDRLNEQEHNHSMS